jgi:hypothetical protein
MRTTMYLAGMVGLMGAAAAVHAGCGTAYDDIYAPLTDPRLATPDGGSGGSGGHGGGDGGLPPECLGDPGDKNITDDCGVFAQADAPTGGDGSKAKPFALLGEAITAAQSAGKRVYACAGAPFAEAVAISAGIEVYGGFDCANGWAWSADARAVLHGPADAVALTIGKNAGGAKVEGLAITAASPSDMKGGGSSIAVALDDVTATLERCEVTAGDAADGADGKTPTSPPTMGANAPVADPLTMNACVLPAAVAGGAPGVTTCDDGTTSGGSGGRGGITGTSNGDGQNGMDAQPPDAVKGKGGAGEDATNDCVDGTKGKSGTAGGAGPGGSAAGDALTLGGVTSSDATDGQTGTKAQGGGGGGGAKSGMFCGGGVDGPGASGGGGGAGGCGGKGGAGGKAGGSSVAIVSLGTRLTLTEVTIAVGKAGKGGAGTTGQNGAGGGSGAAGGAASPSPPSKPGCKGGDGGLGGAGGPGGGARGGHAIGVAYAKAPTAAPVVKTFTPGNPGSGGPAGTGAPMSSNGAPGNAGQCWDFGNNAACN